MDQREPLAEEERLRALADTRRSEKDDVRESWVSHERVL
jgi:hypothetical protein